MTVVVVRINKAVVGSSRGDVPKYVGKVCHAAVLLSIYDHFGQFLGGRASDVAHPKRVILFANVTLLNSAVTSQCHM